MNIFQQKSSQKLEIHCVVSKTCQNLSKRTNFNLGGILLGGRTHFLSQKFQIWYFMSILNSCWHEDNSVKMSCLVTGPKHELSELPTSKLTFGGMFGGRYVFALQKCIFKIVWVFAIGTVTWKYFSSKSFC